MVIPSREDWGVIDRNDLDAAYAFDTFFGRSLADARALFVENAVYFQEELGSLPPIPFRFYVRAFIDYVESDDAAGDSDAASSFLFLFEEMLSRFRGHLDVDTEAAMLATARRIATRQEFFDASVEIYGDFGERLQQTERTHLGPDDSPDRTRAESSSRP